MTLSSPSSPRRARLPRRLIGALAALAVAVGATVAGSAARAEDADPATPSPAPIGFVMAPSGNGAITADAPLAVAVSATNSGLSTVAAGDVRLTTSSTPLASRDEVRAWLDADAPDAARTEIPLTGGSLPSIAGKGTASVEIAVDTAALTALPAGVYPLRADYASAQGDLTAVSVLVMGATPGTGALGVIVPITGPAITTGLLTSAELAELTASDGTLREDLDAVTGTAAILAIDPAVVAAIRVLGSSAPASATRWLDDLMSLPNDRFALQFADADIATQLAAGQTRLLQPKTLSPYMSAADFRASTATATGSPSPTPTPSGDPSTPSLPSLEELTDVGDTIGTVYWPATGTAGAETVATLGVASETGTPITVVASSAVTDGGASAWADAGGAPVLIYDADASSALAVASATRDEIARSAALTRAGAFAALDAAARPDAPLLVAVDRSAARVALDETVTTASGLAGRSATGFSGLTEGSRTSVTLAPAPSDPEAATRLQELLADETSIVSFATVLDTPAELTSRERASLLQVLGNGWRAGSEGAATDAFDAHREATTKTLASVYIVPPSDIIFAATSGPLTFAVHNDLPWAASLVLVANRLDPRLIVQNVTPVTAGPQQNTRVKVPVEARVGSGESTLALQLRSPTMVAIGDTVPVHVSVRAEWESVGLVVGGILVGALLLVGAIRTVRKIRRDRREKA